MSSAHFIHGHAICANAQFQTCWAGNINWQLLIGSDFLVRNFILIQELWLEQSIFLCHIPLIYLSTICFRPNTGLKTALVVVQMHLANEQPGNCYPEISMFLLVFVDLLPGECYLLYLMIRAMLTRILLAPYLVFIIGKLPYMRIFQIRCRRCLWMWYTDQL